MSKCCGRPTKPKPPTRPRVKELAPYQYTGIA